MVKPPEVAYHCSEQMYFLPREGVLIRQLKMIGSFWCTRTNYPCRYLQNITKRVKKKINPWTVRKRYCSTLQTVLKTSLIIHLCRLSTDFHTTPSHYSNSVKEGHHLQWFQAIVHWDVLQGCKGSMVQKISSVVQCYQIIHLYLQIVLFGPYS